MTVERKEGLAHTHSGQVFRLLDLPGAYSLRARSPDEAVARDVLLGKLGEVGHPDLVICVADATNLKLHLRFALELKNLGVPMILALNMFDIAKRRGFTIDCAALSREIGVPVVTTVAVRSGSLDDLYTAIDAFISSPLENSPFAMVTPSPLAGEGWGEGLLAEEALKSPTPSPNLSPYRGEGRVWHEPTTTELRNLNRSAMQLLDSAGVHYGVPPVTTYKIDRVLLNPVLGLFILTAVMFLMFQAVFTWSQWPMDEIKAGFHLGGRLADGDAAAGVCAKLPGQRRDRRCRQRRRISTADYGAVSVHPAARRFGLHGARRLHARPADGRRWPPRQVLHPSPLLLCLRHSGHHGDADDRT